MLKPIIKEVDVLVIGGGPAGIAAAIAAGRNHARTLLVERYGFLGGELITGLPILTFHTFGGKQVVRGIPQELVDRLVQEGGSCGHLRAQGTHVYTWTPCYPEVFKYVSQEMVLESGAEILLHSFVSDVIMDGARIKGVEVVNKSGKTLIYAKNIIDATGDGDIAARAGAPFEKGRVEDGLMQPVSMIFSIANVDVDKAVESIRPNYPINQELVKLGKAQGHYIRVFGSFAPWQEEIEKTGLFRDKNHGMAMFSLKENELTFNTSKIFNVDATNAEDLTRAEIEGRRQVFAIARFLKAHAPGFENSHLCSTAPHIGVRESRRIMGEYVLTEDDVLEGKSFSDSVACSGYTIDIHHPTGEKPGLIKFLNNDSSYYGIPYRSIVPREIDNLLLAGRCISCTSIALGSVRVIAVCMATGQAAGTAAALATEVQVAPRHLDIAKLRAALVNQNAIIE